MIGSEGAFESSPLQGGVSGCKAEFPGNSGCKAESLEAKNDLPFYSDSGASGTDVAIALLRASILFLVLS